MVVTASSQCVLPPPRSSDGAADRDVLDGKCELAMPAVASFSVLSATGIPCAPHRSLLPDLEAPQPPRQ